MRVVHLTGLLVTTFFVLALTGCQTPPSPRPTASANQELDFEAAVRQVADGLLQQLDEPNANILEQLRDKAKEIVAKQRPRRSAVLDQIIDSSSGLHTSLAQRFENGLLQRLNSPNSGMNVALLNVDNHAQAELLVTGTIALESLAGSSVSTTSTPARARVAVIHRKSGKVVAQATALIRNDGFSLTPNQLEQDSPVILLDQVVASQIASVKVPKGQTADSRYLAQLNASAQISAGAVAYANREFSVAAERFGAALADPSGAQLRALTGSYLASVKLNLLDRAEIYFGQMIAFGIREKKLGVKFLFRPGTTDFWQNSEVSGLYRMWLRQLARGVNDARACVELVGHASVTGTESFNDKLSEQRALVVRDRMIQEVRALGSRVSARGVGFREPIVGTGTDDAGDAEDRRVAFTFRDCPK